MKRIKNPELLKSYHNQKCEICGNAYGTSAHHIKSKGSGGSDIESNLMAMCRKHHQEIHAIGLNKMLKKFPHVKRMLEDKEWEFNEFLNKWINPDS